MVKGRAQYANDAWGNSTEQVAYEIYCLRETIKELFKQKPIVMDEELLKDFVAYCNSRPRTSRADCLDALLISYLFNRKGDIND